MEKNLFAWPWSFAQKIVDLFGKLFSLSMRQLKELQANITLSFLSITVLSMLDQKCNQNMVTLSSSLCLITLPEYSRISVRNFQVFVMIGAHDCSCLVPYNFMLFDDTGGLIGCGASAI